MSFWCVLGGMFRKSLSGGAKAVRQPKMRYYWLP